MVRFFVLLSNGPVFKWCSETCLKKPVYGPKLIGPPSHMTLTFEYGTQTVQYSDKSRIQVSGIQMLTVLFLGIGIFVMRHNSRPKFGVISWSFIFEDGKSVVERGLTKNTGMLKFDKLVKCECTHSKLKYNS